MVKGYKAFDKGLRCKGLKYLVGKNKTHKGDIISCKSGLHFCENPLDILDYYDLCDSEFAEVEATGKTIKEKNKIVTNKLKVVCKLDLKGFIKASIDFLIEKTKIENVNSGYYAKLASSGDNAKLASFGGYAQLTSAGYNAQLASSGYNAKLASSGYYAQLASSGDYSVVAGIGYNNIAKAKKGSWIVLAEWINNKPVCVKSVQVDGIEIKEDTYYELNNGNFEEVNK